MSRLVGTVVGVVLIGCGLVGCDKRPPINRGQAAAIADNVQRQNGVDWGDPTEVLEPAPGADGRSWWQLRYRGEHLILVDGASGWGRLPPPGYQPRIKVRQVAAPALSGQPAATPATAPIVTEGSQVLRLTDPAELSPEALGTLEREAAQLNVTAAQTGLHPLFSVRTDRQGRSTLLYGWQGDRGMARDEKAVDWVKSRTARVPVWVELLPEGASP